MKSERANLLTMLVLASVVLAVFVLFPRPPRQGNLLEGMLRLAGKQGLEILADGSARQEAVLLELGNRDSRRLVEDSLLRMDVKRLEARVKVVTVTEYVHVLLPPDTNFVVHRTTGPDGNPQDWLRLPHEARFRSRWLEFDHRISTRGIELDSLRMRDSLSLHVYRPRTGLKGLLRPPEYRVAVNHANPHARTEGMETLVVRHKKRWHERRIVPFIAGFLTSIIIFTR